MKRYWLFAFLEYYPTGGMNDFKGSFDSVDDAIARGRSLVSQPQEYGITFDGWHVFDSLAGELVADNCRSGHVYPQFAATASTPHSDL